MALQIIGAGLGRTGTLSLKLALERLGLGPCHHMTEIFDNDELRDFWNDLAEGKDVDWETRFGHWPATVDWPSCTLYAELAERYPDAKVILTERDPERWYASMSETILQRVPSEKPPADHPMRFIAHFVSERIFGFDLSRENVIASFKRHGEEVRSTIPAERLLVYEVAQGWEPLCRFLDVPVPDEPFPRVNSREEFWDRLERAGVATAPPGR